ncbi:unknown [Cryptophlebia leucotreta granulovirus]|uniref:Uncharacterized protein n=1 Tax=Cryptophlebia leucotreta granulosis virus TaxID=35254 RepID=Q7T5N5_GVCL|nr:hypothetical protein [Cryptophlebia leucotreta granulovirus]AAQ21649.1 unknown [Cryptophlebia leucotreta granulovirus]
MDNFDQLDRLVYENRTSIKQIIMFVISTTLFLIVCSLIVGINIFYNREF